ncbi:MAG: ATP synthase F1 subunit delta [Oscillospiraceae bacterium]|nr:ATP synthase F1 subunit delta [Oscillospiraceae bacterium]
MTAVAAVYGGALYDLAVEEGKTEAYLAQLGLFRALWEENPDLSALLSSRAIPRAERLAVLDRCFSGSAEPYLLNWLKILCEKDAIRRLPDCIRQFELRYNADHGIAEVTAVSAVPLKDAQKTALTEKLAAQTGKQPRVTYRTDPAVLGGMRLEMDGTELDGTVRGRLDRIADELKQLTL